MRRLRMQVSYANVVATLALSIALGGGAFAASGLIGADGTIRGCVLKSGVSKGAVRIVASGTCRTSERAIRWSAKPGPTGLVGPAGSVGATGPAGSPDTPPDVLAKLITVDGSGSALDADSLDGLESSALQKRGSTTSCAVGKAVTAIAATGDVSCATDATAPSGPAGGDLAGSYPDPTIAPGAVTAPKLAAPEAWHAVGSTAEPSFQNNWVNNTGGYATAAFRKDVTGRIELEGIVKSGTVSNNSALSTIFTLPAAYRPTAGRWFPVLTTDGASTVTSGLVAILSTGAVSIQAGDNRFVSLELTFTP